MAGHSKWANIKHRKGAQDKKRSKEFTKYIRAVTVAAKHGDPDPDTNSTLRLAVDKAKAANVPKDTIINAIKRASRDLDDANVETIIYEGYGASGVAVMVECLTDNRNRTVAEVRHAFTRCGGNLGTAGSVSYLFSKQGIIIFAPGVDEDQIMEVALEIGAEDVTTDDDGTVNVITSAEAVNDIKDALIAKGLKPEHTEITQTASTEVVLDKDGAEKMIKMLESLEDLDDVQEVYSNANIPDELLQEL